MAKVVSFIGKKETPKALVRLSDNFCEQTNRPLGLKGKLLGPGDQEGTSRVKLESEEVPVRVYIKDYTIIN